MTAGLKFCSLSLSLSPPLSFSPISSSYYIVKIDNKKNFQTWIYNKTCSSGLNCNKTAWPPRSQAAVARPAEQTRLRKSKEQ